LKEVKPARIGLKRLFAQTFISVHSAAV
jgi:hypothetical protein